MDLSTALERLANYRTRNSRASQEIFESGVVVFRNDALHQLGDDSASLFHACSARYIDRLVTKGWAFLEQLTLAAIDVGRLDVAEGCIKHLSDKFPGSPRVEVLEGIYIEASQSPDVALVYYDKTLEADPANAAAWKRKISVLRRTGKIEHAVTELSEFLDTFYTDVEGWLELADIYSSCNQYTHALQSLQHVLLLAPQNPFHVLQAAETAYTAGDIPLAIKFFLVVVDMTDEGGDRPAKDSIPTGITVRAWYGVELCTRRLQKTPKLASSSPSQTPAPEKLDALEKLAKDMLHATYSSQKGRTVTSRKELERWLGDAICARRGPRRHTAFNALTYIRSFSRPSLLLPTPFAVPSTVQRRGHHVLRRAQSNAKAGLPPRQISLYFTRPTVLTSCPVNALQVLLQILNFASVLASGLMIWKGLGLFTNTESPIVVVLSGSMEPAFYRGDLLFLTNPPNTRYQTGDITVYKIPGQDIPIVHRVLETHDFPIKQKSANVTYASENQKLLTKGDNNYLDDVELYQGLDLLERNHIVGKVTGFLPYVGYVTIAMSIHVQLLKGRIISSGHRDHDEASADVRAGITSEFAQSPMCSNSNTLFYLSENPHSTLLNGRSRLHHRTGASDRADVVDSRTAEEDDWDNRRFQILSMRSARE
ncbi:hypothetical protein EVG20_g6193 [Dentipellis fragilis]|uniref:signal peptidase I n=1 Tax=Dentipellis fragilis TaxID=205917 RepID=A0A4Y9YML1_9AGAM|nr:hypothetical protein EVG20_g6193 [Dentipellis fragilis]